MTKTDLINVVSAETEVSKKTVDTVVNGVLDAIANALKIALFSEELWSLTLRPC